MFNHASSTEATWHTLLCADHWTIVVVTRERTGRTTLSIHLASRTGFIDTCSEGKVAGKWKIGYSCFFACFPDCILWIEDLQVPHFSNAWKSHSPNAAPKKEKQKQKGRPRCYAKSPAAQDTFQTIIRRYAGLMLYLLFYHNSKHLGITASCSLGDKVIGSVTIF